jgi:hypothetical protein
MHQLKIFTFLKHKWEICTDKHEYAPISMIRCQCKVANDQVQSQVLSLQRVTCMHSTYIVCTCITS